MRTAGAAIIIGALFAHIAAADEIKLRCDPVKGNSDVVLVVIDTTHNAVKYKDDEYINGRTYHIKEKSTPSSGSGPWRQLRDVGCDWQTTDSVTILDNEVTFNASQVNVNSCGLDGETTPGILKKKWVNRIDRQTGILYHNYVNVMGNSSETLYQCQKFTGNAF